MFEKSKHIFAFQKICSKKVLTFEYTFAIIYITEHLFLKTEGTVIHGRGI